MRSLRTLAPRSRVVDPGELIEVLTSLRSSGDSVPPRRFTRDPIGEEDRFARGAGAQKSAPSHRATHHFASMEIPIPDPIDQGDINYNCYLPGDDEEELCACSTTVRGDGPA